MDHSIREALRRPQTIDITTTGRRTGQPRRIELVFHNIDGRIYLSGMPRRSHERRWLLNMRADPRITFHLKQGVVADLPATVREITEPIERQRIMEQVARNWNRTDVDFMMIASPLVEVIFDDLATGTAA